MRRSVMIVLTAVALLTGCGDRPSTPIGPTAPGASMNSMAASGSRGTAVTSTIADADSSIAPSLQIRSDGIGTYRNSSTLISQIQSIGAWELDSYNPNGATRTMYLDFSQPVAGSGPTGGGAVPIPSGLYKVHMIAKCNLYNNSFLTIAPGATVPCPLHIGAIFVGAEQYALQMNPRLSAADTAWAETNWTNVTCVSSGVGSCTAWSITPSSTAPDGSSSNVAALLHYVSTTTNRKTTTAIVKEGDFQIAFHIVVTNP
jgi:hypothetical protein